MLRNVNILERYTVEANDGPVGSMQQLLFDVDTWTIRYLVVVTGKWLGRRQVLLSPIGVRKIDAGREAIVTNLTLGRIKSSPMPDVIEPLSREYEAEYHRYFGWGTYWTGASRWGQGSSPSGFVAPVRVSQQRLPAAEPDQPHLRSTNEVKNYRARAQKGELGRVTDLVIDDFSWAIRLVVLAVEGRWPNAQRAVLSPHWVERIDWINKIIDFDVAFDTVKQAPPYDPALSLNHEFENGIFKYYGRERDLDAVHIPKKTTVGK
jgi:hypothetical protein